MTSFYDRKGGRTVSPIATIQNVTDDRQTTDNTLCQNRQADKTDRLLKHPEVSSEAVCMIHLPDTIVNKDIIMRLHRRDSEAARAVKTLH